MGEVNKSSIREHVLLWVWGIEPQSQGASKCHRHDDQTPTPAECIPTRNSEKGFIQGTFNLVCLENKALVQQCGPMTWGRDLLFRGVYPQECSIKSSHPCEYTYLDWLA